MGAILQRAAWLGRGPSRLMAVATAARWAPTRAYDREGLVARVAPFAVVGMLAVVVATPWVPPAGVGTLLLSVAFVGAAVLTALVLPWERLPRWADLIPPLLYVVSVALVRHAAEGAAADLVPLFALPIVWVAMYGTRAEIVVLVAGCALATLVPALAFGPPQYPDDEWQHLLVNTSIGLLVGATVNRLVHQIREHDARESARAASLAEKEAHLRSILETSNDAVVGLRPDGRILELNPAAREMFRIGDVDVVGRDLIATMAVPEEQDFLRQGMARLTVLDDRTVSRRFRTDLLRLDGDAFPAEVSVGVVPSGGTWVVNAFARDITDRVHAERETQRTLEDGQTLLAVGRKLADPATVRQARATICEAALSIAGATLAMLLERDGSHLAVTASAGADKGVAPTLGLRRRSHAGTAFRTGEPVFVADLDGDARTANDLANRAGVRSGYWQPIKRHGAVVGVLAVCWNEPRLEVDPRIAQMLLLLGNEAEIALQMNELLDQLDRLATSDGLTGLANRRSFDAALALEVSRAVRSGGPLSLVMLDLDHFKAYNDTYGHPAGDQLLAMAAAAWRACLRPFDTIARYGGEEFAVILPDAPPAAGRGAADRLRAVVPAAQTVSAGVATWTFGDTPASLLARADAALYAAKHGGRNRTEMG